MVQTRPACITVASRWSDKGSGPSLGRVRTLNGQSRFSLVGLALVLVCACTSTSAPLFELAPATDDGRAQIYFYRTAESGATHDYGETVSLDGVKLGNMRAPGFGKPGCQYLWVNVAAGQHRVVSNSASHWFNLGSIPADPMEMNFVARSGRLYFVNVNRQSRFDFVEVAPPGEVDELRPDWSQRKFEEHVRVAEGGDPDPPPDYGIDVAHSKQLTISAGAVPSAIRSCRQMPSAR